MKIAMQDVAKKLALWHTPTFRPIITHDDLEPIMASIGFVSLSKEQQPTAAMQWKEYCFGPSPPSSISPAVFCGVSKPRPRLPFPRIDGLHLLSYKAFLCALEQYISPAEVHNLFHVRAMPLTRLQDRVFEKAYRPMKGCEIDDDGIYVFRDGTIDHSMFEQISAMECSIESDDEFDDIRIKGSRSHSDSTISLVPWDSLLPDRERSVAQADRC
ncbi:uncharacterized protein LOC110035358 [Phalaenopsis equestris]|uniref:uncharacterized protein LOC110035358 n=1 Tax=Phalaenopsis equestris TaxID=78828 RepID=UPI0009E2AD36|nr:uncharacterized protein LOC110035358 [Phalaenopsis equestris]